MRRKTVAATVVAVSALAAAFGIPVRSVITKHADTVRALDAGAAASSVGEPSNETAPPGSPSVVASPVTGRADAATPGHISPSPETLAATASSTKSGSKVHGAKGGPGPAPNPGSSPTPSTAPTPPPPPPPTPGPTGPRGPQSSITCPSGAVSIAAGQSWQSAVNANPSGTTFCILAGTHAGVSSLAPKNDDAFIGQVGAVVDGGNSIQYFINSDATGVTVKNLVVQHFESPQQDGAIEIAHGVDWVIANNNISYNYEVAVYWGGSGNQIRNNVMNYNGREAYACANGTGGIMDNNEIGYNNTRNLSTSFEAGGGKCGFSYTNLEVSNNWVHNNTGAGLWTDTNNKGFVYEYNLVENNTGQGIDDEVSCNTTIRYNTIRNNGNQWGWHGPMGIWLANSSNDDVYSNTLVNNGMMAVEQDRNDTPYSNCGDPTWHTRNNHFHDNTVTLSAQGQQVGLDEDNHDTAIYSGSNWFQTNTYTTPSGCDCWEWNASDVSWSTWRGAGQDTAGSDHTG